MTSPMTRLSRRSHTSLGLLLLTAVLTGCQTIRAYPVCYFAKKPSPEEQTSLEAGWKRDVAAFLGKDADVEVTHDDRWVIAKGLPQGHETLKEIWPRLGCIGPYASGLTYPYYSHCLDLLQKILEKPDYLVRGKESDFLDGYLGDCNGSLRP